MHIPELEHFLKAVLKHCAAIVLRAVLYSSFSALAGPLLSPYNVFYFVASEWPAIFILAAKDC